MASLKSSRIALKACPPATELKLEVSVALKTKAAEGPLSVLPPKVPVACARAAAVGLGSPGC